ncbi:MAG: CDP-glucose 4,6-dehydratase [Flavobacteriales bacterium]|nr:CDP-glucose 4,6-dehydratase [Flavobacteriales bacterium]MDW8431153.1 CDP-glucose 4,6-dehydratase [Flavobacteriales bacterium]
MMKSLLQEAFKGKRVFLTGHTGFKGAWMVHVLHRLGAEVWGYALPPESEDWLYSLSRRGLLHQENLEDIRHPGTLGLALQRCKPHFVLHMAAQSLVRRGYSEPRATFETNVTGTLNVLEAVRHVEIPEPPLAVMIVTTDKVYENNELGKPFHEGDPLGGHDPYSASKAACEVLCASYRRSFLQDARRFALATVRSGNVIGGGDRAQDRLLPDIVRAWRKKESVRLRYPLATRPWQHVLEPLIAYLMLLALARQQPSAYSEAWNVGPQPSQSLSVAEAAALFCQHLGAPPPDREPQESQPQHEARYLALSIEKITQKTPWHPRLSMQEAIQWTADWEKDPRAASEKCFEQIERYLDLWNS